MLVDLGLEWGQSQQTLIKNNFNLKRCETDGKITSCEVIHSVKGVAYGAQYILYFDETAGLQKLEVPIRYLSNDNTGEEGKSVYNELKNYLIGQYDQPHILEYIGRKLYGEYDEFYQCLHYKGCGSWVSFWEHKNGEHTYLGLIGVAKGTGYLVLLNESKQWQEIAK